MRHYETVEARNPADYISKLVHEEWLNTVIASHDEKYQEWADYGAWLIEKCTTLEQRSGTMA